MSCAISARELERQIDILLRLLRPLPLMMR